MAAGPDTLLHFIRRLVSGVESDGATDGALLDRFISERDETAFTALVDRHGPLVFHVCRRVLGDIHETEDAFQATFLILARKAASVRPPEALPAWLHVVARRVALKAQSAKTRQIGEARPAAIPPLDPQLDPLADLSVRELLLIIDEELEGLPELYRLPVILCCLEGRSLEEAARQLGWTPGSVKGRLERGRTRLHQRLIRRGLTLSAALVAAEVSRGATSAATIARLAPATVRAAVAFAGGQTAIAPGVSAGAAALAGETLTSMGLAKLKIAAVLALTLAILTAAAGVGARHGLFAQADDEPAPTRTLSTRLGTLSEAKGLETTNKVNKIVRFAQNDRGRDARAKDVGLDLYGDPLPAGALARLGTARLRQGTYIGQNQLAFTPEGNIWTAESSELVLHINNKRSLTSEMYAWKSEAPEPVLHLWDRASGKELARTRGPKGTQVYFLTSQAGRILAVGGIDEVVQLWEAASGKVLQRLRVSKNTRPVALSSNGKVLITIDIDPASPFPAKTIRLWEMATGRGLAKVETPDQYLRGPAFSADGKMFLTGWARPDSPMRVWDTASGQELLRFVVNDKNQYCWRWATFSPNGKMLALAAAAGGILLWDLPADKEVRRIPTEKFIVRMAYSPDGDLLAGQDCDSNLFLWDAGSGKELRRLKDDEDYPCWELAFSADGRTLATWGKTNAFVLWDVASGKRAHRFEGALSPPRSLAFGLGGKVLVAESRYQNDTPVWDVNTGKLLRRFSGHLYGVSAATVSPDGALLATGSWDGKVRLWDLSTGKELRQMTADGTGYVGPISFSPDGKTLISSGFEAKLRFFEVGTGQEMPPPHRPPTPEGLVLWFVSSPGGGILALLGLPRGENTIRLWNPASGKELFRIPNSAGSWASLLGADGAGTCCFSPDGKTLAAATGNPPDQTIGIWELATGRERCRFPAPARGISSIAFSPDGKLLALGGYDQNVHLVKVATGKELSQWRGHSGWVLCVGFSPDGKTLVSGSSDTTVLIWKLSELIGEERE